MGIGTKEDSSIEEGNVELSLSATQSHQVFFGFWLFGFAFVFAFLTRTSNICLSLWAVKGIKRRIGGDNAYLRHSYTGAHDRQLITTLPLQSWQCLHYITVFTLVQHSLTISSCEKAHCHFRGVTTSWKYFKKEALLTHPLPTISSRLSVTLNSLSAFKKPTLYHSCKKKKKHQGHHHIYLLLNSALL